MRMTAGLSILTSVITATQLKFLLSFDSVRVAGARRHCEDNHPVKEETFQTLPPCEEEMMYSPSKNDKNNLVEFTNL